MTGFVPHVVLNLEATSRGTIWRWVTHHANRPIYGPERLAHILTASCHGRPGATPLRLEMGGFASVFKPCFRLRKPPLPLVVETVPLVGSSLDVKLTPRYWTTLTRKKAGKFSSP